MPALVGLGALVAAGVQATTGLGFALVLTPMLFGVLAPTGAVVLVTVLGLELNLLVLLAERRRPNVVWREVGPILIAAAPGTMCGLLVLRALSKPVLQIAIGWLRARADRRAVRPGSTERVADLVRCHAPAREPERERRPVHAGGRAQRADRASPLFPG